MENLLGIMDNKMTSKSDLTGSKVNMQDIEEIIKKHNVRIDVVNVKAWDNINHLSIYEIKEVITKIRKEDIEGIKKHIGDVLVRKPIMRFGGHFISTQQLLAYLDSKIDRLEK